MRRTQVTFFSIAALALAMVATMAAPASAAYTMNNPSFEDGDLSGWTATVPAWTQIEVINDGSAPVGDDFARIHTADNPCLGCGVPTQATMLSQIFTAETGDVVTGYARFEWQDTIGFNDSGAVTFIDQETSGTTTVFSAVGTDTGWTQFQFVVPADGDYMVRGSAINGGPNDDSIDSWLDFDLAFPPLDPDAPCTITGTPTRDVLNGTPGDDVICGLGGNDTINGLGGDDILRGGDGNDRLLSGLGDDLLQGENGQDFAWYANASGAINLSLTSGAGSGEGADELTGVEHVRGSVYDDTIIGDANANRINGGRGKDVIIGDSGPDKIMGSYGADTIFADIDGSPDTVDGGKGPDGANDYCKYDAGVDTLTNCETLDDGGDWT